jgi:hypothetical protein
VVSVRAPRPRVLTAQNLKLVPKHQQLDVFHVQATVAKNERAKQSPNGDVEEGEDHAADPPSPRLEARHEYWRPSRQPFAHGESLVHQGRCQEEALGYGSP